MEAVFSWECPDLGCPTGWDAGREGFFYPCHAGTFAQSLAVQSMRRA